MKQKKAKTAQIEKASGFKAKQPLIKQKERIQQKINDINITTLDQLITILRSKRAGDPITVEILRGANTIILDFTLDLRPSDV